MTFTKTGVEFPDDLANAGLSDAAYRTHHEALTWIYTVEQMDLHIGKKMVRRFAGSDDYEGAIVELIRAGFWVDRGAFYEVEHHRDVVTGGIVAQRLKRERDKVSQQKARKKAAEKKEAAGPATVSGDVSADVSVAHGADPDRQTNNQALEEEFPGARDEAFTFPGDMCSEMLRGGAKCSAPVEDHERGRPWCAEHLVAVRARTVGVAR